MGNSSKLAIPQANHRHLSVHLLALYKLYIKLLYCSLYQLTRTKSFSPEFKG